MKFFAIGDIHGCFSQLTSLHKNIFTFEKFDPKNDLLIYLGDYIDRGKYSKEVINQILKLNDKDNNITYEEIVVFTGNNDNKINDKLSKITKLKKIAITATS